MPARKSATASEGLIPVAEPARGARPSAHELLVRAAAHPVEVIGTWSPDQFELFAHEWVYSCVRPKYAKVVWAAGAGDKGRDVRAYVATEQGDWDSYQCKRYEAKLTPGDAWLELGKLCHYTHLGPERGGYRLPRAFYFVAQHGVGPTLQDLIENPSLLRSGLLDTWAAKCRTAISNQPVELDDGLRHHIGQFPFERVSHKTPREMIDDIAKTPFYPWFFGYRKFVREPLGSIPDAPTEGETTYVGALCHAYADHLGRPADGFVPTHLDTHDELRTHFRDSRECFYYAEQLLRLGRDTLPPGTDADLLDQMKRGVINTVRAVHTTGYARVLAVTERAGLVQIGGNDLAGELKVQDRTGLCHHLANDGHIAWVKRATAEHANG